MNVFLRSVECELTLARAKHPPIHSLHEGYAVILEEIRELEAEVFQRDRERLKVLEELIQVAAMCCRMAEDCDLIMHGERIGQARGD